MLGIGFKVSDVPPASLSRPLRDFLAKGFGSSLAPSPDSPPDAAPDGAALDAAVAQFAQLKADADLVRAPSDMARRVLLRYYAQLERMAQRFDSGPSGALQLPFTWNDSFCPRKKTSATATGPLRFEMAAVLFNVGALASQLGVQTDRSDADGLKAACRHFMQAAGAFATIRDELTAQFIATNATPDMSAEGLAMLVALMLAQAQACFYEKAIKDGMKDAVKAKLVHQALEHYAAALELCESPALRGVIDRMWGVHVRFQVLCMRAATQFWQAKAAKEVALARGAGYGEEIARLQAADALCSDALSVGSQNKLPQALVLSARALQKVVEQALWAAKKDNASIYLENVPALTELPPVGKASMVRALPLTPDELANELTSDLFAQFVPQALLTRAARAKEDVNALLEAARARVAATSEATKQKLHALGLPAAIEAFEKTADDGIPPALWLKVQQSSDPQGMEPQLRANDAASERAEKQLRAIESRLSAEEIEDNVCRQNYGAARWPRPASAALNDGFRLDIDRYYRLVKEAKESDKVVAAKLADTHELLALLGQPKAQLDAQLPRLAPGDTSSCHDEIAAVSALLRQLTALADEKDQVLADFAASHAKMNVLPILMRSPATSDPAAVDHALADEKQFFETHFVAKLDAVCADEASALDELTAANAQFEAKKASDHVMLARQAFLQKLGDAVDTYDQLQSHLKEGAKFYEELATRIGQLQQTVDDHCAARDLERREMELHVQADDAQRQRETHDAAVAAQMMRDMQLRDDAAANHARDEAFARQLAGGVPQHFQQPPQPPTTASSASSSSSGLYGQFPAQPPPQHPYTAYQQSQGASQTGSAPPAYSSIFSSSPSSTPQFGNYYYAQQQQQQYAQPPPPNAPPPGYNTNNNTNNSYYQYPGATYPPANGQPPFPRPPGGSV